MTHIRFTREYRKTLKRIVSHYTICDKMKKCKHLDWIILILCIIGFIIEFLCVSMADIAIYILGVIGVLYCIYHIFVFCCRPIKRDWILAKGNFLIKVVNFVLLIPFVVTLSITLPGSLRDDKSFSPRIWSSKKNFTMIKQYRIPRYHNRYPLLYSGQYIITS